MDLERPTDTPEAQYLIDIFQYYQYMWPRSSCVLSPLIEADSGPKVRKIPPELRVS